MKKLFGYFLISLPLLVIVLGLAYTFYIVNNSPLIEVGACKSSD